MSDFKTHLSSGLAVGSSIAFAGFSTNQLNLTEAISVGVVGTIGGLLPDIDSDTGKPLQLLFQLVSVLIPVFLYEFALEYFDSSVAFSICYFALFYLFINYLICPVIKNLTAHRGIIHSIPFAIICGEAIYIALYNVDTTFALYSGTSLFAGAMIHLIFDELNSMTVKGFIPSFNSYSGTALTFKSKDLLSMTIVYGLLTFFSISIYMNYLPDF